MDPEENEEGVTVTVETPPQTVPEVQAASAAASAEIALAAAEGVVALAQNQAAQVMQQAAGEVAEVVAAVEQQEDRLELCLIQMGTLQATVAALQEQVSSIQANLPGTPTVVLVEPEPEPLAETIVNPADAGDLPAVETPAAPTRRPRIRLL